MYTAYLAQEEQKHLVRSELEHILFEHGRLFVTKAAPQKSHWSQNIWFDVQMVEISSIKDAVQKLTAVQRSYWPFSEKHHRRLELIVKAMPHVSGKPQRFPAALPKSPLGSFTLLDEKTLFFAANCSSLFPNGEMPFIENKIDPPSRAYLKLWETFTLTQVMPKRGDVCIDLGASPGGWTWVLKELGAKVIALDRAPLREDLMTHDLIEFRQGNAFTQKPGDFERVDWFFSDVICYPEKLLELVKTWLAHNPALKMVCTLKFQGSEHYGVIKDFEGILGGRLIHLSHNKHELTWIRV